ncbi:hypothetical protein V8B55DRAFT_1542057 [Mucor lusitanicus]|uniref:K Homology domain-containing protein n=2 Tax=Mucor circinelloides f. lusitanicus TaxID=29924 RepID=A0A162ZCN2_MUCCL|nr:hypothetical protein FB192DRAFT_1460259 [Mucor lusitanicus]OAD06237.1 hypothetical protein MUCCIDRAFT_78707 [Mucor lusitanicus CBS 277.49]
MTSNESLDTLSPAAKLALLHAQAANPSTNQQVEQDPFVPSPDDPVVVMDNSAYEPLIAGDFPTPIGKPISSIPAPKKEPATKKKLDLNSEAAFPSLSASPRAPVASGWSSAASSRVKAPQGASGSPRSRPMAPASGGVKKTAATQVTDVLELPANQQISNMSSKPLGFKSSADVIQQVINKTGTNIIASTNRSGTTTFLIQGTPNDVARAKRELIAGLVVKRTVEIAVPANTRRFIIGAKGANLKQIEASTNTRVNFPRKDDEDYVHHDDDSDEAVIVTIIGDTQGIRMAKEEIEKIVGEKAAKQTIKIDNLDNKYYLFLAGPQNSNIKKLEEEYNVKIHIPAVIVDGNTNRVTAISITGDKEKVQAAKQALEKAYADIEKSTRSVAIGIPKHQHKYLYGKNGETLKEILAESNCTVEIPPLDDPSENVTIIGPDADLVKGLTVIMEKARSHHVIHLDVTENYASHGNKNAIKYARCAIQYMKAKNSFKQIEKEYNVEVGVPSWDEMTKKVGLDFVSKVEKDATLAQKAVASTVRDLTPDLFGAVDIEAYLHQYILSAHRAAIDRIQSSNNVSLAAPQEKENSPTILIVYVGDDKSAAKAALENASAELKKLAADSSDYICKSTNIPIQFHDALRGPKGTTLNAIVGETEAVVRFGPKEKVEVRGLTKDVNQVMASLQKAFDAVQQDDFTKPYTAEFFIPANFSAHIIGKAGIHINKLKDDLGVKIDIGDNNKSEEKTAAGKKDKKNAEPVKVVIQGPKINVEAAKERINSQVSNLADQVTLSLKVPKAFHRFLIGPSGRYVKKLEDKYNVFIKFPKSGNRGDESPSSPSPTNPDEITVRGGKKDAQSAKEELMELYEYEKEEQEKRKEREQKHKEYEEKRAAEDKRRAEERAAREARDAAKEAAREAKRAEKEAAAAAKKE